VWAAADAEKGGRFIYNGGEGTAARRFELGNSMTSGLKICMKWGGVTIILGIDSGSGRLRRGSKIWKK